MSPRRIAGRFELDDAQPARGGMAAVHRAVDLETGRRVAVKVVRPVSAQVRKRFVTEWELLARIQHPGIVRHVASGQTDDGDLYMAMEWLDGEDLATRLGRGRLSLEDTIAIARQVGGALAEVHRHGVIHRDIKPANIYLPGLRAHAAKLLDFGVARVAHRRMTGTGGLVGTPGYLAPEQARGSDAITPATDVFALGLTLFECLTGLPAYSGSNPMALLVKVAVQPPPELADERPDLPRAVTKLVAKMTAHEPTERVQDARKLMSALDYLEVEDTTDSRRSIVSSRITDAEQALLSVVIVAPLPDLPTSTSAADTLIRPGLELPDGVVDLLAQVGAPAETLLDGSLLVTVRTEAGADAQAAVGARVALALATARPERSVALASGRAAPKDRDAIGRVIERATALAGGAIEAETLESIEPGPVVHVDRLTAELIGRRYVVRGIDDRLELVGVRLEEPDEVEGLIGRDAELSALLDGWDAAGSSVVVVEGGAGIGKSALLSAYIGALSSRAPSLEVLDARGEPVGAHRTFGLLDGLLRSAASIARGDEPDVRRAKVRARLASRVPAADLPRALAFCAELVGAPVDDAASADARAAAADDPALRGAHVRRACEDWLRGEASTGPTLLRVEDAHLSDAFSLAAIAEIAERVEGLHVALSTRAPLELPLEPRTVHLGPLDATASERLAREAMGALASEPEVQRVVAAAGGNPLFVRELSRAVLAAETELPSSLVAIAHSRFASLGPDARRALRAASVFGLEAELDGIRRLLGGDGAAVAERGVTELTERGLLRIESGRVRFQSTLLREAAYESLTPADRAAGHGLAAHWLSERGDVDPLVLVEHWSASANPELAIPAILAAAEMALAGNQFARVVELAARAEALGAPAAKLGRACFLAAEAHRWSGATNEAADMAERAMSLVEERSDVWFASIALAIRMSASSSVKARVSELSAMVLAIEVRPQDRVPMLAALGRITMALLTLGYYDLAALLKQRMDELVTQVRSLEPFVGAWVHAARAAFAHHRQDLVEFREELLEAAGCFAAVGNQRMEVVELTNAGYALNEIGAPDVAERELDRAAIIADELGLVRLAAAARQNLAVAQMRQGRTEDAVEILRHAEYLFEQLGDRRFIGGTRTYLAEAFRELGRLELAAELADRAQQDLTVAPPLRAAALALLGQIHLDRGDPEAGLLHATQAYEVFKSLGQLEAREELVLLVRAKALKASGDEAHARQAIQVAAKRLEERADRIESPRWRDRFLRGGWDRVETMTLLEEWTRPSQPG